MTARSFFDDTDPAYQLTTLLTTLFIPADIMEFRLVRGVDFAGACSQWHQVGESVQTMPKLVAELQRQNDAGCSVFFGANPRKGKGLRGDLNICIARHFFVDVDDDAGGGDADLVLRRAVDAGLPDPTIIKNSGHGTWLYWLLAAPMTDMAAWRAVQQRIAGVMHGDPKCVNPERIARCPGFLNIKPDKPAAMAHLISVDSANVWAPEDITRSLPELPAAKPAPRLSPPTASSNLMARARSYLARIKPPVYKHRNDTMFQTAGHLFAFGLSEADVQALMSGFNMLADPPLEPAELMQVVKSAKTHGTLPDPKPNRPMNHRQIALRGREVCGA